jgi:hypothetical protein
MSLDTDEIFRLLPAFLRLKDAEEGRRIRRERAPDDTDREIEDFGPLRTLASLVAREGQILREGIDAHYANAFIETCAPWVIPYLGELLGVRGLADIPEGIDMRARVANALELRSRKGTLRALEHASTDASGWPVYAVEYWKRLVHTQSMRLTHPEMGKSVDMRDKPALARIGMAFERDARNVEVRRIETAGGRWNLGNIGLHVWRLRPYAITLHRMDPVGTRRDFRFHPLGCDAQLFARTGIRGGVEEPAREIDMPAPITRAIMAEDESRFYGPGRAIHIRVGTEDVPVEEIRAANLGSLPGGGPGEPDWTRTGGIPGLTLIDPELGRVVIDPDRAGPVRLSCHFARPLEIGGGEHSRVASVGSVEDGATAAPSTNLVTTVTNAGGAGVFLLEQSTHYTATGTITVPADEVLRIVAADGHFPTIRIGAGGLTVDLGQDATLELNGLRIHNDGISVTGSGAGVTLTDCTLVPGHGVDIAGEPIDPGALSLDMATPGAALRCTRSILGPVRVAGDVDARLTECILDAGSPDALAYAPNAGAQRVTTSFDRCTVLGRVETSQFADGARDAPEGFGVAIESEARLATSDTIFAGRTDPAVAAEFRQVGCIRFSYVPANSITPRLYRCIDAPEPQFQSARHVDPDYMLLVRSTDRALARGAENGGEMGVYNRAAHQVRGDNIRRSIEDFLRFGHAAGAFHET